MTQQRYGISDAARLLGISPEALRQRVRRGNIEAQKGDDGRWYIHLDDTDTGSSTSHDADLRGLMEEYRAQLEHMRNEVEAWKEESRRKDSIIMQLLHRVPELEPAPQEEPRSLWRRLFRR